MMLWNSDVLSEMERLRGEMDSLFSNMGRPAGRRTYPLANMYDNEDSIIVTAELPGLKKEDVGLNYTEGILTISGRQGAAVDDKKMVLVREERPSGEFEKELRIPCKVKQDEISARFNDGVLTVTLPKAEEAKPKTIKIEAK